MFESLSPSEHSPAQVGRRGDLDIEANVETIDVESLRRACGGTRGYDDCVRRVEKKALYYGGMHREDGKLTLPGARDLINSVQGNGFHDCERAGLNSVLQHHSMTSGAKRKLGGFLRAY